MYYIRIQQQKEHTVFLYIEWKQQQQQQQRKRNTLKTEQEIKRLFN